MEEKNKNWHAIQLEKIIAQLDSNQPNGLTHREAQKRQEFGKNVLPESKPISKLFIFLSQLKSPLAFILVLAGLATLFLGRFTDTIVIFIIVLLNSVVGFLQEYKASNALRALKKILKTQALVLREGEVKMVFQEELVLGDIVLLKAGQKVPADLRIIESRGLRINEAALTGEWLSQNKQGDILPSNVPLPDRSNMAYMSTVVEEGEGLGIVVAIGGKTELGKMAGGLKDIKEEKTPYQKKLTRFSKIIGIFIAIAVSAVFIEGIILGKNILEMFFTAVAIAVAAIPEGLPVSMTVILAVGMQRLLKEKGLVRHLASAETLGSTSVIITDKTLTLTEGKMKLAKVVAFNKEKLFQGAILANDGIIENPQALPLEWKIIADPTSKALIEAALENGFEKPKIDSQFQKLSFLGLNTKDKTIACFVSNKKEQRKELFVAGSPETIISSSDYIYTGRGVEELTALSRAKLQSQLVELVQNGWRVIGFAHQTKTSNFFSAKEVGKLIFSGFLAFEDPIRPTAKTAFKICQKAGLKVIIATGDHLLTAQAVAKKLGLKAQKENCLTGADLDGLSDIELNTKLAKINIYGRVEPRHKLRLVALWQSRGEVVAMTGDGINDGLALKKADIGVALGSGTQVAKEASDLVLLNDNFSILEKAVEEGRGILDNIRKVIVFLLSDSLTEIILVGFALLAKMPLPLTAVQILWVNLLEDGLPNIALAFEPKEKDLMQRKPEKLKTALLNKEMKMLIVFVGLFTNLFLLGLFVWLFQTAGLENLSYIRTMLFAGLALDSLLYLFSCKSLRKNVWRADIFSNKLLIVAFFISLIGLLGAIYLPFLQRALQTTSLNLSDWAILGLLGIIDLVLIEGAKYIFIIKKNKKLA